MEIGKKTLWLLLFVKTCYAQPSAAHGETALHYATTAHDAREFIRLGLDPFSVTTEGETALHYAARLPDSAIAASIITAIIEAIRDSGTYSKLEIKRLINQLNTKGYSALYIACQQNFALDSMQALLENGADTMLMDPNDGSLLIEKVFQIHSWPCGGKHKNLCAAATLLIKYMPHKRAASFKLPLTDHWPSLLHEEEY